MYRPTKMVPFKFYSPRRRSSFAAKPLQHDAEGCPLQLQLQMLQLQMLQLSSQQWPEMHMAPTMPPEVEPELLGIIVG